MTSTPRMTGTPNSLRRHRLANGMRQDELAAQIGVHEATVGKWERGEQAISARHRSALDTLFGRQWRVDLDERGFINA